MDYEVTILLLDMSKAFDTVKRNTLMKQLKEILGEDELHIMKVLLTDVKLKVRIGKELGKRDNNQYRSASRRLSKSNFIHFVFG